MLKIKFFFASLLYKYCFPLYRFTYFRFKNKQDAFIIKIAGQLIESGSTVVDIGANIGFFSAIFSNLVKENGRVISFEPDKTNFSHLKNEIGNLKNVTPWQKAVSSENGELMLYVSDKINVDHRTYKPESYKSCYPVEKIKLDDYFKVGEKVGFIKMDIQGAEMDALKGMERILKENNLTIVTELWPFGLEKAGYSAQSLISYFKEYNYLPFLIGEETITPIDNNLVATFESFFEKSYNAIFTKLSHSDLKKKIYGK